MACHPSDRSAANPRLQCSVCGKWKRLHQKAKKPPFDSNQNFFGGCHFTGGDHLAGDKVDVCVECCETKCREMKRAMLASLHQ